MILYLKEMRIQILYDTKVNRTDELLKMQKKNYYSSIFWKNGIYWKQYKIF